MRDVQLNGQPLLVEGKSTQFGLILRRQGVTMGCHSSACSSQPCYSPFLCVDLWRKYECRYIKPLVLCRGSWEVLFFHLGSGNLPLSSKTPCCCWPERGVPRTNHSLHLISHHEPNLPFPASMTWNLLFHHFYHVEKITCQ